MNILAHAWLSCPKSPDSQQLTDDDRERLIGGFVADFIKGDPANPRHGLRPGVVAGVIRHRRIDEFTDTYPPIAGVRAWLHPRCHKYAGVAVDVFFDHFLARDFYQLTGVMLTDFVPFVYQTVTDNLDQLPADARRMAESMIRHDWLTNYQFPAGIDRTLKGLSHRTAYPSGLDTVMEDFDLYYDRIGVVFGEFWGKLVELTT